MIKSKRFWFCVLCFISLITPINAAVLTTDYQKNFYSNRIIDGTHYSGLLAYPYIDGEIVYCLNPEILIGSNYEQNQVVLNGFSKDQLEYMSLIAHYGYNAKNNTLKYYAATQQLIWKFLNKNSDIYWSTEKYGNGEIINLDEEIKSITENVENYYKGVSFENNTYESYIGEWLVLNDENHQLANYELEFQSENVIIDEDKLFIKIETEGDFEIKLKYKNDNFEDNKTFISDGHQNLINFGFNIDKNFSVYVKGIKKEENFQIELEENENVTPPLEEQEDDDLDEEGKTKIEDNIIDDKDTSNENLENINQDIIIQEPEKINNDEIEDIILSNDELPNTYNLENKYYLFNIIIFMIGIGVIHIDG